MIRTAILALALALPTYAMAQQDHVKEMKAHEDFVQSVIDKRASLKLTDAQVVKLKAFKTKMAAHHKEMMKQDMKDMKHDMKDDMKDMKHEMKHDMKDMKHEMKMDDPMHKDFLAIFTPAQRKQVDVLMKEHMKACGMSGDGQCKIDK